MFCVEKIKYEHLAIISDLKLPFCPLTMTRVHMQLNYKRKLQVDQAVIKTAST